MEVQQTKFLQKSRFLEGLHSGENFGDWQAEFGLLAHRAAPATGAAAGKASPQSDQRCGSKLSACIDDALHLVGLFDHHNGSPTEAAGQDGCFDVATIFVAVTDQQGFRVVNQGERNQQFGFAPRFQAEIPAPSTAHQLLHHVALLVAFHWKHTLVPAFVAVPRDCSFEGGVEALQAVFKDVVEPDQQRQMEVAALEAFHQFHKIKTPAAFSPRLHADVAAQIDREVGVAPAFEAVKLSTLLNIPWRTG